MGCLFGGLLAEGGLHVTLLARRQSHVDAIREHGLVMLGEGGDRTIAVNATTDATSISPADVVLFQCKAHHTPTVAAAVMPLFAGAAARGTVAISFQNGLGNEQAIATILGNEVVLGGLTAQGATLEAPGVVRSYAKLPTQIGELDGGMSKRVESLAALFTAHGLAVAASDDIMQHKWRKLLMNVALSASSGITDLSIRDVLAIPELAATARRAMAEAAAVAAASGIILPDASRSDMFDTVAGSGAAGNKTSMCRDILARRPSELDAIYGSVIRLGQAHGVPTPTLQTLAAMIRGIESRYA